MKILIFYEYPLNVERGYKDEFRAGEINYLVLIFMFVAIVIFGFMNLYEPQFDQQFDFFELMFPLSEFVAGGFGLVVAKKYWGSEVLGKAYLSLGIGLTLAGIGATLFNVLEITNVSNPFPNWPDIFIAPYYLCVFYHLTSCARYFNKKRNNKLSRKNKLLIILLPLTATSILTVASFTVITITGGVPEMLSQYIEIDSVKFKLTPVKESPSGLYAQITVNNVTYELVPVELTSTNYEQTPITDSPVDLLPITITNFNIRPLDLEEEPTPWFMFGNLLSIYYFAMTTINLSFAIVGVQVFRNTILGNAWGLLLLGIALTAVGDLIYYSNAINGYDRTYPDIAFWVFGYMIISYALYLHRKRL
ncbi:MAG: hypothetical protein ACREAU_01965 [Nitrosopumilaceae archaeon]